LSLAAPRSAGGTSVAERKAPPPSAREEADCYRQTLSDDQGGGFFSRLFGSLFGRSSVPDYCQPYLRQPERAGGPKPAPGAARLQLSADDMDEVRKMAAEFKRDDLLPPDFAGGKSGE